MEGWERWWGGWWGIEISYLIDKKTRNLKLRKIYKVITLLKL